MGRDVQVIAGLELARRGLAFEQQAGAAGQQHHPFSPFLVPPEAGRARLALGHDPVDPHVWRRQELRDLLVRAAMAQRGEQVLDRRAHDGYGSLSWRAGTT
jgi:hypothetical protein